MNEKIWKLMVESFDRGLSKREARRLQRALEDATDLREEQRRLAEQRRLLAADRANGFAPGFADRVMDRIGRLEIRPRRIETFYASLRPVFGRVALAAVAICLLLISFNIIRTGDLSVRGALAMNRLDLNSHVEMYSAFGLEE